MDPIQKFTIAPYNGYDDVSRQDCALACHIALCYQDLEELDEYCIESKIEIKNCSLYALKEAIDLGHEALINHIFEAIKGNLEISIQGITPLLSVMLNEAPAAFPTMRKLVEAGAQVNTVAMDLLRNPFIKDLPGHATPLYIAAEKTKHVLSIMLLLKHQAVAHPALSEEGTKLVAQCQWLVSSGKLLFMCLHTKELIFRNYDLCMDLTSSITRLSLMLD